MLTFSCHKVEWFSPINIYISIIWISFLRVLNLHFFYNWFFFFGFILWCVNFCGFFWGLFMFYTQSTFIPKHSSCLFLVFSPFYLYLWFLIIIFIAFSFVLVVSVKIKYWKCSTNVFFVTLAIAFAISSLISCWTFINAFNYNYNGIC